MAAVFRDYDRAALERQYTIRRPEIAPLREARERRVAALNREVMETRPRQLDLVYGVHPRARLDYYPTADDFAPLVVFIHGGFWRSRSKDQFAYLAPVFTDAGANFVSLEYPLAPEARLADIVESCRRAVHWLLSYPRGLRFDPSRLYVAGHSAGAHLAAMLLATDWGAYGLPRETVKGAVCVSGLYDLTPLPLCRHLADLGLGRREVDTLSPVRLAPACGAEVVVAVGGAETAEFHRNADEFAAAWRGRGMRVTRPAAPGRHHFDVLDELLAPGSALARAALRAVLKG